MRRWTKASLLLLLAATVVGCVNETEMRKRDARDFLQKSTGEYTNEAGELLFIAPVYARMIGFDTFYLERSTPRGPSQRLIAIEPSPDGEKLLQFSYAFTQPAQWREVRAHPCVNRASPARSRTTLRCSTASGSSGSRPGTP